MRLLDARAPWLHNYQISESSIITGDDGRFGIGASLVAERACTRELLFARKSYRSGFEGNGQFTFPGGMVRATAKEEGLERWLWSSLATRVASEIGLTLQTYEQVTPLDVTPPVVAAYTVKGQRRYTVILPFATSLAEEFCPRSQDATVYDPGWRTPMSCWSEITPTNRLIAAYYLWPRLSQVDRLSARPFLEEALAQASRWATEVCLPPARAPWVYDE